MSTANLSLSIAHNKLANVTGQVIASAIVYSVYVAGSVVVIQGLSHLGASDTFVSMSAVSYAYAGFGLYNVIKSNVINPISTMVSNAIMAMFL